MKKVITLFLSIIISCNLNGQNLEDKVMQLEKENRELKESLENCMNLYISFEELKQIENKYPKEKSQTEIYQEIKENHPKNLEKAKSIIKSTTELLDFCDSLKSNLVNKSGGRDSLTNRPIGCKDKEIVTQIMFKEENAKKLKKKIINLRKQFLQVGGKGNNFEKKITLEIKEPPYKNKSWVDYKFSQMPMCAILPMITAIQGQAEESEIETLKYLNK